MGTRLFVGGLSFNTDDSGLRAAFEPHGRVIEAKVIIDRDTGRSRGFGFVNFADETEARNAVAKMDGAFVDGRTIRVNEAQDRPRPGGDRRDGPPRPGGPPRDRGPYRPDGPGDGPPRGGAYRSDAPNRGGYGDGPPRGGYGDGPPRGGHGDGPPRGGYGDGPPRGGYGDGPPRGGYGDGPPRGGYGDGPPRGGAPRPDGPPRGPGRGDGPPRGGAPGRGPGWVAPPVVDEAFQRDFDERPRRDRTTSKKPKVERDPERAAAKAPKSSNRRSSGRSWRDLDDDAED